MAIIIRKNIKDVSIQQAVNIIADLPKVNNKVADVRFVKSVRNFYIFNGYDWQEVEISLG